MTDNDLLNYFVGIWGRMQLSMKEVGLVNDRGDVIKSKWSKLDKEAVDIYLHLDSVIEAYKKKLCVTTKEIIFKRTAVTDDIVKKLINDNKQVNNHLLAMFLYQNYLFDIASKSEQILMMKKVQSQVDDYPTDTEHYNSIRKNTAWIADNIWRQFTGKAQLSDEVRRANAKRFMKNK